MSAFCSGCGSGLPVKARYCPACGTVVMGMPPTGFPPYAPRLTRPIYGRQFAGVCMGIARTYGWDVGLLRVVTVVLSIFTFPIPIVVYLACWIGIPEEIYSGVPQPPIAL